MGLRNEGLPSIAPLGSADVLRMLSEAGGALPSVGAQAAAPHAPGLDIRAAFPGALPRRPPGTDWNDPRIGKEFA